MNLVFRPEASSRGYARRLYTRRHIYPSLRERRTGELSPICRTFARLHHLGAHAPDPIQQKWRPAYRRFMNRLIPVNGSARYTNTWSADSWL